MINFDQSSFDSRTEERLSRLSHSILQEARQVFLKQLPSIQALDLAIDLDNVQQFVSHLPEACFELKRDPEGVDFAIDTLTMFQGCYRALNLPELNSDVRCRVLTHLYREALELYERSGGNGHTDYAALREKLIFSGKGSQFRALDVTGAVNGSAHVEINSVKETPAPPKILKLAEDPSEETSVDENGANINGERIVYVQRNSRRELDEVEHPMEAGRPELLDELLENEAQGSTETAIKLRVVCNFEETGIVNTASPRATFTGMVEDVDIDLCIATIRINSGKRIFVEVVKYRGREYYSLLSPEQAQSKRYNVPEDNKKEGDNGLAPDRTVHNDLEEVSEELLLRLKRGKQWSWDPNAVYAAIAKARESFNLINAFPISQHDCSVLIVDIHIKQVFPHFRAALTVDRENIYRVIKIDPHERLGQCVPARLATENEAILCILGEKLNLLEENDRLLLPKTSRGTLHQAFPLPIGIDKVRQILQELCAKRTTTRLRVETVDNEDLVILGTPLFYRTSDNKILFQPAKTKSAIWLAPRTKMRERSQLQALVRWTEKAEETTSKQSPRLRGPSKVVRLQPLTEEERLESLLVDHTISIVRDSVLHKEPIEFDQTNGNQVTTFSGIVTSFDEGNRVFRLTREGGHHHFFSILGADLFKELYEEEARHYGYEPGQLPFARKFLARGQMALKEFLKGEERRDEFSATVTLLDGRKLKGITIINKTAQIGRCINIDASASVDFKLEEVVDIVVHGQPSKHEQESDLN